ncbi:protein THEMIS [Erpetoichthys calabaricus]|uniref:protein THEMIS n=1 Tax=Erpetoichthys calabaricus TaxID=27687 RepID=UPI0010A0B905|nr:protein THEMIS [Erpetoichthys calabaricus]
MKMALSLEQFISSLDCKTLPRIIQIQSGIYFQGSIYEMFGNECCLPTGEVIKIISIKISKVSAEIHNEDEDKTCFDLPLDFPGLFRIVADRKPYVTLGEIAMTSEICPSRVNQIKITSANAIQVNDEVIQRDESIILSSLAEESSEQLVNCEVIRKDKKLTFTLPLSFKGEFYECEDDQFYTLAEIIEWKMPKGRKRTVNMAKTTTVQEFFFNYLPENFKGELDLAPIYELQAVMKFRKDIVHIPSTLDVEVIDVTDKYDMNSFVQPLSLHDIFSRHHEDFPMVAEIIEGPEQTQESFKFLKSCKEIIIYKAFEAKRILASEIRSDSQKYFLIPTSYNGKFKRRPREFPTAYDLEIAKSNKEQLHVVATKEFGSHYEGLQTVSIGDQFLVQHRETSEVIYDGTRKMVEALACEKIKKDGYESVLIPMCMEGGFVEVIHDKKQYQISEICQKFQLPFNVKVSVRDLSIKTDVLATMPGLHLEEEITGSYLLMAPLHNQAESYEIPVNRIKVSLQLLFRPDKETEIPPVKTIVEQISEDCYYTLRRYVNATLIPPPRPPKKPLEQSTSSLQPGQPNKPDTSSTPKSPQLNIPKMKHAQSASPDLKNSLPEKEIKRNLLVESAKSVEKAANSMNETKDDYEYIDQEEVEGIRKKMQGIIGEAKPKYITNEGNQYE